MVSLTGFGRFGEDESKACFWFWLHLFGEVSGPRIEAHFDLEQWA